MRVPIVLAVGFWAASALAVGTYTLIAFKETANGLESGAMAAAAVTDPLVASAAVLAAEEVAPQQKPLQRGIFKK